MSIAEKFGTEAQHFWRSFILEEGLTEQQAMLFERYLVLLSDWNEKINLTRIVGFADILAYHFQDSMRIGKFIDLNNIHRLCDVGTGGGFPGIPLKILYPELSVILLEVNTKKINFLHTVIQELALSDCTVCTLDWRTFLRQAPYEIDLFVARASLKPEELIRLFKAGCSYKNSQLIYWASTQWQPTLGEKPYLKKTETYTVGNQKRVFAFFYNPEL